MNANFKQKENNLEFFGLNFDKLPNYVRYFACFNIDGVAESRVEIDAAVWRWMGWRFTFY